MSPVILWFIGLADSTCWSGFEPVGTTAVVLGSRRCSRGDSSGPTTTAGTSFSRLRRGSCAHAGAQVLCRYLREGIRVSLLPPSRPRFYSDRLGFIVSTRYILSSRRYALDVLSFFHVDGVDWISSNGFCFVAHLFEIYIEKFFLILL